MVEARQGRGGILSRRVLLYRTLGTLTGAAACAATPKPASAAPKISQAAVAYQDHPDGDKRCGRCLQFVAPESCKLVDGPVSPQGFCRIFTPLRQAAIATGGGQG